MGRILSNDQQSAVLQDREVDFDTADRLRPGRDRTPDRLAREAESDGRNTPRTTTADVAWRMPLNLDAPPPRPGMRQRWVRANLRSENDNLNWQIALRQGYRPRDPATVPEAESYYGTMVVGGKGVISVGGLVLMEIEEQRLMAKRNAIREIARTQERSVSLDTEKASADGIAMGFPGIEREDKATVSTGRRPATLAN